MPASRRRRDGQLGGTNTPHDELEADGNGKLGARGDGGADGAGKRGVLAGGS